VLAPPAAWGADIACGDIQPLGMHQHFGGGHAGFIATHDDPRFVMEFPSRLFGITSTRVEGEYGFATSRTSGPRSRCARRQGVGWHRRRPVGHHGRVYLALMGPRGMVELGEGMMARTRYAMDRLGSLPGVRLPFAGSHHVKEFVVDLSATGRTVPSQRGAARARDLRREDLSAEFQGSGRARSTA